LDKRGRPWKPSVKNLVVIIVNNNSSTLSGDCSLCKKGWQEDMAGL